MDHDLVAKAAAVKSEHKAIGVVCFGYFRYRNARFGCAEVHQAIQCFGRKGMTDARRVAQADGYTMVHAMTDCTFLQKPGLTRADARRIARRIADEVGVVMDLEGVYKWVVFLPSKTHSATGPGTVGVPNRYYGKFDDGKLKVRGIEVQRHSTCDWIYETQQGMLDEFVKADTPEEFLAQIPAALAVAKAAAEELRQGRVDGRRLGIMVQATRSVEAYTATTNTQTALRRLRNAGTERRAGEYVKYVVTRQDGPREGRVVPIELWDQGSTWFGASGLSGHKLHYLRLLARSIETLLSPFGYEEEAVLAWLSGATPDPLTHPTKPVIPPPEPIWQSAL